MTARIIRHPSAPIVSPALQAQTLLDMAAAILRASAEHTGDARTGIKADMISAIADEQHARAMTQLARLSSYQRGMSA